jgi:serine/threonine protein kinase
VPRGGDDAGAVGRDRLEHPFIDRKWSSQTSWSSTTDQLSTRHEMNRVQTTGGLGSSIAHRQLRATPSDRYGAFVRTRLAEPRVGMGYQLLDQIGSGGMATVHRARQTGAEGFERIVAVKQIAPHFASQPDARERFIREATIGSMLTHANIVQVHDFVEAESGYFLAMEYVDGRSLGQLARVSRAADQTIPLAVVLSIVREPRQRADHAHRACQAGRLRRRDRERHRKLAAPYRQAVVHGARDALPRAHRSPG